MRRIGPGTALVAVMLIWTAADSRAADDRLVKRLRAESLAAQGRCEEALPLLAEADPADPRAARVAGQCQIRLRRYPEAVESLERARRLDPALPGLDRELGIALYHTGDRAAAETALRAAQASEPDNAEVDLYLGLLALQRAENIAAAIALERARARDPNVVEPIASFYAGLAREAGGDRDQARESLERVIATAPGSVWAEEAERALERLEQTETGRWWITATTGIEYDDNVALLGDNVSRPRDISSDSDIRAVWSVEAGYELVRNEDWTVGVLATYYGSAHQDLEDFNVQFPGISLWVDRRLTESLMGRFQYDFGYAWVGGSEPFQVTNTWTPALYQSWGRGGLTRGFVEFEKTNYFFSNIDNPDGPGRPGDSCLSARDIICGPPGRNEDTYRNRDGWGLIAGLDHTLPLGFASAALRGGYRYHRWSSRGGEYSYQGHEVRVGMLAVLPLDLRFEILGSYIYKPYRNASSFPDPNDLVFNRQYPLAGRDRSDDVWFMDVTLERPISDSVTLGARYLWLDNRSNVAVFDYDRQILGAYVTFSFGP